MTQRKVKEVVMEKGHTEVDFNTFQDYRVCIGITLPLCLYVVLRFIPNQPLIGKITRGVKLSPIELLINNLWGGP